MLAGGEPGISRQTISLSQDCHQHKSVTGLSPKALSPHTRSMMNLSDAVSCLQKMNHAMDLTAASYIIHVHSFATCAQLNKMDCGLAFNETKLYRKTPCSCGSWYIFTSHCEADFGTAFVDILGNSHLQPLS